MSAESSAAIVRKLAERDRTHLADDATLARLRALDAGGEA